jgi:hypothetical protein
VKAHETIDLLTALKTLDPRGFVVIDDTTIQVWGAVLNREPAIAAVDAMQTAYTLVATPGATFPTPGDFRALVGEITAGIPSLDEARRQIERAMRENYPGMPAVYTPDPLVLQAVRSIGGIAVFRNAQNEQQTSGLWRQFDAAYRQLRDRRVTAPVLSSREPAPALDGGAS